MSENIGDLRVWHVPQVPGDAFLVPVVDFAMARKVMEVLADYDLFQYENNIKPDYANASGVSRFNGEDWVDCDDELESEDWSEE